MEEQLLETLILDHKITFPEGLPGFADAHDFVLVQAPEEKPFACLKSLEFSDLSFAVIEAFRLVQDYTMELQDEHLKGIGSPTPHQCAALLILKLESGGNKVKIFANLKAPILLNTFNKQAKQVVLANEDQYSEAQLFEF